jgi:hypothetical protein
MERLGHGIGRGISAELKKTLVEGLREIVAERLVLRKVEDVEWEFGEEPYGSRLLPGVTTERAIVWIASYYALVGIREELSDDDRDAGVATLVAVQMELLQVLEEKSQSQLIDWVRRMRETLLAAADESLNDQLLRALYRSGADILAYLVPSTSTLKVTGDMLANVVTDHFSRIFGGWVTQNVEPVVRGLASAAGHTAADTATERIASDCQPGGRLWTASKLVGRGVVLGAKKKIIGSCCGDYESDDEDPGLMVAQGMQEFKDRAPSGCSGSKVTGALQVLKTLKAKLQEKRTLWIVIKLVMSVCFVTAFIAIMRRAWKAARSGNASKRESFSNGCKLLQYVGLATAIGTLAVGSCTVGEALQGFLQLNSLLGVCNSMLATVVPRFKKTKLEKAKEVKVEITKDTPVFDVEREATLARLVKFLSIETPNGGDVVDCLYGKPFQDPLAEYEAYIRSINLDVPPFKALDDIQRMPAGDPRLENVVAFARLRAGEVLHLEADRRTKSPDVFSAAHELIREAKVESKDEESVQQFTTGQIAAVCIVLGTAIVAAIVYMISAFTFRREMEQIVKRHVAAAKQPPGPYECHVPGRLYSQVPIDVPSAPRRQAWGVPDTKPTFVRKHRESANVEDEEEEIPLVDKRVPEGKKVNRQHGHDKKMDRLTGSTVAKGSAQIKRGAAKPVSAAENPQGVERISINPNQYDALRHLWQLDQARRDLKRFNREYMGYEFKEIPISTFRDAIRNMAYGSPIEDDTRDRFSFYVLVAATLDWIHYKYSSYENGQVRFPKQYGWMNGKVWLGEPGEALPGHTTIPALLEHCNNLLADPKADLQWKGEPLTKANVFAPTVPLLARFSEDLLRNKAWVPSGQKEIAELAILKHKQGETFVINGPRYSKMIFGDEEQSYREGAVVHETTQQSVEEIVARKQKKAEKKKAAKEKRRAAKAALSSPKSDQQVKVKPTLVPPSSKKTSDPPTPPKGGKKESASVSGHFTVPEGLQHGVVRVRVGSQLSTGAIVKYPGYGNVFQMTRHGLEDDLPTPGKLYHFEEMAFWHEGKLTVHSDIKLTCIYLGKENILNDDLALFHAGALAGKMIHQYSAGNLIDDQKVKIFGYSGIKIGNDPVGHLRHGDGTVHAVHSKAHPLELLWDSETFNGMSGSVLLASSGDKFFVGGMHTAGYDKNKTPAALRYNRAIRSEDILNVLKSLPAKN